MVLVQAILVAMMVKITQGCMFNVYGIWVYMSAYMSGVCRGCVCTPASEL